MQKKLIALAVAGLASSAAFAQSNVTVYGVADVYYGYSNATGQVARNAVNSGGLSGSRLGFKGTEDLGNGLKALFTLEYGLSVDDNTGVGAGSALARQQFVGLTGGFGTAIAGRLQTAGYDFSAVTNGFHGTAVNPLQNVTKGFGGSYALTGTLLDGSLIGQSSRASNALAYVSPSFGGVVVAYNHARLSETANTGSAGNPGTSDSLANLLSATWTGGPAAASVIYTNASLASNQGANTAKSIAEWAVGGSYDFGVAKLYGSYQNQKVDTKSADKAWQLSGVIPTGAAGKVLVGYAQNSVKSTAASDDSKSWTLAYLHSLSKRTTLYTGYTNVKNDSGATLGTALTTTAAAGNSQPTAGGSARGFVAGINHSF